MSHSAPTVLVVDDDDNICWAYEQELIAWGYRVTQARDGKEALNLLSAGQRFNVILTDMNMPKLDGVSLILEIIERGYRFEAVVLATAASPDEPVIEHLRTAINGQVPFYYHSKTEPLTKLEEFLSVIKRGPFDA